MLKKIFTNTYTALFLYIPTIAYIAGLLYMVVTGSITSTAHTFLYILLIFLPLLVYFGYIWAKKFINRVNFTAHFAIFALLIYALFCLNLAFVLSGGSYSDEFFGIIALFSNPIFIITNFLFLFSGEPIYAFLLQIILYGAFGGGFALGLWKKGLLKPTKLVKILTSIVLVLAIGVFAQWSLRNSLFVPSSIAKLESVRDGGGYDFKNYTALRGSPTLTFEDNFPKLDSATALCPVSSSAFEAIYLGVKYRYDYFDCSRTPLAYERLFNGEVELIFAAAPSEEQLQMAKDKGIELTLTPIGKEAFVFLVNRQNPVKSLSIENIRDIYSGKITNWRELGGENEKILAFQRNQNSGSQTAMQKYVMKDVPLINPIKEEFYGSMGGMIEGTADYRNAKNAIGYSFRYYASVMNKNENIKLLSVDGVEPTVENIKNNSYPFAAEFYIVSTQNISINAQKLIDWFLSEQGQALVEDVGYVRIFD